MMTSPILLVVEELLPNERYSPVIGRMLQYLKSGVSFVFLVDNVERSVLVYRKGNSSELFKEDEEINIAHGVPGAPFRVSDFLTPFEKQSEALPQLRRQTDGQ